MPHNRNTRGIYPWVGSQVVYNTARSPGPCTDGLPLVRGFAVGAITGEKGNDAMVFQPGLIGENIVVAHGGHAVSTVDDIVVIPTTGLPAPLSIGTTLRPLQPADFG